MPGFVRGFENAEAELRIETTETEVDRFGDPVETPAWEALITLPLRLEDDPALIRDEQARFVRDTPAAFIEPNRLPRDLEDESLPEDAEWPFVDEGDRLEIDGTVYEITAVRTQSVSGTDPDVLALDLEGP